MAYPPTQFDQAAFTTPTMASGYPTAASPAPDMDAANPTIKMEDLTMPMNAASSQQQTPSQPSTSQSTSPQTTEQKPQKKRKSWGQVLPEPKTNLPPRKRAKTEDEKEQRRIERVKRNRLAAHNSRERKRQEVEQLQAEKEKVELQCRHYESVMAKWRAKFMEIKQLHPDVSLDDLDLDNVDAPAPAPAPVHDTPTPFPRAASVTICPNETSHSFPSPVSMTQSWSSRDNSLQPETPPYTESYAPELDMTRYPAEILCDLQCRSSSSAKRPPPASLQAILTYLFLLSLSLSSMMSSLWTTFSTSAVSPSLSNLMSLLLPSPPTSTSCPPSTTPTPTLLAWWMLTMLPSSACRQQLAQLTLATAVSQPMKTSTVGVARPRGERRLVESEEQQCKNSSRQQRLRRVSGRRQWVLSSSSRGRRSMRSTEFYRSLVPSS